MSKKVGIIVSLVLALVFTILIVNTAERDYRESSATMQVARTTVFIPAGEIITAEKLETVEVPQKVGEELLALGDVEGKSAVVSLVKGQYITVDAVENAGGLKSGYVEVFVPVDLSSSAMVLPGYVVNVHIVNKETGQAPAVLENVQVLHVMGSQGQSLPEAGQDLVSTGSEPAAVGLEVPKDRADELVLAASQKVIYLTRAKPGI